MTWVGGYDQGIYVLLMENDNYYIGASKNLGRRINKHFMGEGSLWTKTHDPIDVITVTRFHHVPWKKVLEKENEKTVQYMKAYGTESVRGGKWHLPNLEEAPKLPDEFVDTERNNESLQELARELLT